MRIRYGITQTKESARNRALSSFLPFFLLSLSRGAGVKGSPAAYRVAPRATSRVLPRRGKTYRVRSADISRGTLRVPPPLLSLSRGAGVKGSPAVSRVAPRATSRVLPRCGKTYRVRTADISRGTLRVPHSYLPISVFSPFSVFGEYVQQNDRKPPDFPDYANLTSAPFPWYNETVIRGPP